VNIIVLCLSQAHMQKTFQEGLPGWCGCGIGKEFALAIGSE